MHVRVCELMFLWVHVWRVFVYVLRSSISIHEGQCLKKFEDQQALLPPEQRKTAPRRVSPGAPGVSREERNAEARRAYEEQVMVACPGCGRTFSGQDRLDIHMKGCDAAKGQRQGGGPGMRECMVPEGRAP